VFAFLWQKSKKEAHKMLVKLTSGANLINIQRLGLRLRLKKALTHMHRGLRLTFIFQSYKHELEAY